MIDIDEVYAAAFDRDKMPGLLASVIAGLDAQAGFIAWTNLADKTGFEFQVGNDPAFLHSYRDTYWQHDTLRPTLFAAAEGVVAQARDLLADEVVREGVFYREWLAPQLIVDNLAVNLFKRPDLIATIAILRKGDVEAFGEADIAALNLIVPHLTRVIYIQSRLTQGANLIDAYRQVMDGERNGLVLLDESRVVVDAAGGPREMTGLQVGQGLKSHPLHRAMGEAIESGAPVAITLNENDGERTLLCVAKDIAAGSFSDMVGGPGVRHAVHVIGVDHVLSIGFDALAKLYSLTATEAKVLADVVAHADIKGAGLRHSMGMATVRTHLHRIYAKTGATGLADLTLLAHRFSLPNGYAGRPSIGTNPAGVNG